jgi:hypothetical protein
MGLKRMKKFSRLLGIMGLMMALIIMSTASALAATNWDSATVTAEGTGVAPPTAYNSVQARMLARRAAIVDAYRQLAEQIKGVNVDADTTVENMMVTSDVVRTHVSALVQGARIVDEKTLSEGGYSVTLQVSMFGVSNSLATAVLERPQVKEAFPPVVQKVEPSIPLPPTDYGYPSTPSTKPMYGKPSSAANAPSGRAIGGYTGLIVDCRGLGLKPVMSPVIKNTDGTPIYGYKNLDYDKVIENGMAGYVTDISRASRAGTNPLIVRAVSLDNHNGNPVLSLADANRVLIENGATGFLDTASVVFLR